MSETKQKLADALEALREVEWAANTGNGPECPWCGGYQFAFRHPRTNRLIHQAGHLPECEIDRLLPAPATTQAGEAP